GPAAALSPASERRLMPRLASPALLSWMASAGMPGCQAGRPVRNYTQVSVYRLGQDRAARRAWHIPKPGPAHVIRGGDSAHAAVAGDCPASASVQPMAGAQALRLPPRAGPVRPMPAAAAIPSSVFPG